MTLLYIAAGYLAIGLMIGLFVELRPYHKPLRIRLNPHLSDVPAMMVSWPIWVLDRYVTRAAAKIDPRLRNQ